MSERKLETNLGYQNAGLFSKVTYSFVGPLLSLGSKNAINDDTADAFLPDSDRAEALAAHFEAAYQRAASKNPERRSSRKFWHAFFLLYRWRAAEHLLWCLLEVAARVGSPLLLRQLLEWLVDTDAGGADAPEMWRGWMWAGLLGAFSYFYLIIHHQLFFRGMRMGMEMRVQSISAVYHKALRLNAAALGDVSAGRVVNLVSNDVRRFDEAATFWVFLVGGPIELLIVFVLVGLRLNFAAAAGGVSALLALIPMQALLARRIGRLRLATAGRTDERVRLTSEAIHGILAFKMLAWEQPLLGQLRKVRRQEAHFLRHVAFIRGINMALTWAIGPLTALCCFATARYTGAELTVANLFYALALLSLPKMYMAEFFVHAVEACSELRVSVRRIGEFLALPEPPIPPSWVTRPGLTGNGVVKPNKVGNVCDNVDHVIIIGGADFDWKDRSWARPASAGNTPSSSSPASTSYTSHPSVQRDTAHIDTTKAPERHVAHGVGLQVVATSSGAESPRDYDGGADHVETSASVQGPAAHHGAPADDASATREPPTLRKFSLQARAGELIAIVGAVGSGKSSVLSVLLGELHPRGWAGPGPAVRVVGSTAYVGQVPWITSGTVRENVLFGHQYDKKRYKAVLHACALKEDLASMPAGDLTEIGERGISISGGQKARLALARAAYSCATVQCLDDPLSAVDPRVGQILFRRCIGHGGLMNGSTRILVTHQRQYLPFCDRIIVLRHGEIAEEGTYADLAARDVAEVVISGQEAEFGAASADVARTKFRDVVDVEEMRVQHVDVDDTVDDEDWDSIIIDGVADQRTSFMALQRNGKNASSGTTAGAAIDAKPSSARQSSMTPAFSLNKWTASWRKTSLNRVGSRSELSARYLRRFLSRQVMGGERKQGNVENGIGEDQKDGGQLETVPSLDYGRQPSKAKLGGRSGRLIVKEDQEVGAVTWSVYMQLIRLFGTLSTSFVVLGLLGGQVLYLYSEYWLASWAAADQVEQRKDRWVWVYAIFTGSILIIYIARSLLFFMLALHAASSMHDAAATRLLYAPLSFFHTNPAGRILNRFSKDQGAVDETLPVVAFDALQAMMAVFGALALLAVVVPYILPLFLPLGLAFMYIQRRYLRTSRELKRFEAVTRSPLYAAFSATLKGLSTIRAFRAGDRFAADFVRMLTINAGWWFSWLISARWIGFRLDFMVSLLLTAAPLLIVAVHDRVSPRLAGLALTQSLYLAGLLQWCTRQMAEVEVNMTSVERLLAYCHLPQEPAAGRGSKDGELQQQVSKEWPRGGALFYDDVTAMYRPGLPAVLQGITFNLPGGVSCGVVGRTGSGKSSLMLTLFRLIPITGGRIVFDGVDTSTVSLNTLRRQIAVIPQDPVLFSGSLRSNLDPWGSFDDASLWQALEAAQLRSVAAALGGLDARMAESGENLSVGQRQLLCLARALLQDAVILALDEATANVDRRTDEIIQVAVRRACAGDGLHGRRQRTLLVIAHRIDTIMDCDRLLVLSDGKLIEEGVPTQLAEINGGVFAGMVRAARSALGGANADS